VQVALPGDESGGLPVQLPSEQLQRLARLARLDPERLSAIEAPSSWRRDRIWAYYCATCVFLNPADVTAPRWKRAWLDPGAARCDVHDMQLETIPARSVRSARNFEHLLRMVSKLEEKRRQKRWIYQH
jgi:hypothetical protein